MNGIAHDFYSDNEHNNQIGAGPQWLSFPLPSERYQLNNTPWTPPNMLPEFSAPLNVISTRSSGLVFVDKIFVMTTVNLTDRHAVLQRTFSEYHITNVEWRSKWTHDTCNSPLNKAEVYAKLNLKEGSISNIILVSYKFLLDA